MVDFSSSKFSRLSETKLIRFELSISVAIGLVRSIEELFVERLSSVGISLKAPFLGYFQFLKF